MNPVYIFDIDGTIADHTHRLHLISKERMEGKDWAAFHDQCHLDPPIVPMCRLARQLILSPAPVIFLTGRMEFQRRKTQEWLAKHVDYGIAETYRGFDHFPGLTGFGSEWLPSGPFPWLAMRAEEDFREDTVMKGEWLDRIEGYFAAKMPNYKVMMAFEDRPRICELWKQRGLTVAKIGDWREANQSPASEAFALPQYAPIDRGQ